MGKYADMLLRGDPGETEPPPPDETYTPGKYSRELIYGDTGPSDPWIGDIPLDSVMSQPADPDDGAGFLTQMKTGFVDDPQAQIKIYAATRFPDLDQTEREKKYGIHNGEVVFVGDKGKLYRETPDTWASRIKRFSAREMAHLPSYVMAAVSAYASGGMSLPILAAAGGEGYRKAVGSGVFGETQTVPENLQAMALEGGLALGGEAIGRAVPKGINRLLAKRAGPLASAAGPSRGGIDTGKMRIMEALGNKFDIDLYAPQTTGSRALAERFNLLGDLPGTADAIEVARRRQMDQVDNAAQKILNSFAPPSATPMRVGGELVEASQGALRRPIDIRANAARPHYQKAHQVVLTERQIERLTADPVIDRAVKRVQKDPVFQRELEGIDENSLKIFDYAKRYIGDEIDIAKRAGKNNRARLLKGANDYLLKTLDDVSPDYRRARKIFGDYSKEVEKQSKKTILSRLGKMEGDDQVLAVRRLFGSIATDPTTIRRARTQITNQNPEVWDRALRVHLGDLFDKTQESLSGDITNVGGHFYKKVWGSPSKRKLMRAAMSPQQFSYMKDFMTVMKRLGPILKNESKTATRQVALKEMTGGGSRTFYEAGMNTYRRLIGDRVTELLSGQRNQKLVQAFLSGDGAEQLKKLRQLPEGSEEFSRQAFLFVSRMLGHTSQDEYRQSTQPDMMMGLGAG